MIRSRIMKAGLSVLTLMLLLSSGPALQAGVSKDAASKYLKNVQSGNPGLKSVGKITFGPGGLLVVADPAKATITVIDTHDTGALQKLEQKVPGIDVAVAASLGVEPSQIDIADMAVNSESGKVYLSVNRKTDNLPVILVVDATGKVKNFDLSDVEYIQVSLPGGERTRIRNITGVALASDRLLVAAHSNEEFANKIYSIPLPLTHGTAADIVAGKPTPPFNRVCPMLIKDEITLWGLSPARRSPSSHWTNCNPAARSREPAWSNSVQATVRSTC